MLKHIQIHTHTHIHTYIHTYIHTHGHGCGRVRLYAYLHALFIPLCSGSCVLLRFISMIGGTGYIGKYVVKESVSRGYDTTVVVRPGSSPRDDFFAGANVVYADVCDQRSLQSVVSEPVDAFISCLASRSGVKEDSYKIDYQATLNSLNVARSVNAKNFILLSAFCVQKPLLQFQHAKLKVIYCMHRMHIIT